MRLTSHSNREGASRLSEYTLPEVMMRVLIMSIMLVSHYLG
jgi:hypothetical protein